MPSRRQIREAVVQFLYSSDLENVTGARAQREPFWDFITESLRRDLQLSTVRTVQHLSSGRDARLAEFVDRQPTAMALLSAWPQAEHLKIDLQRIAELESSWSIAFGKLDRIPRDDHDAAVAAGFSEAVDRLFSVDRDLSATRVRFLNDLEDQPALRAQLEPVAATIRRLQKVSEKLRMAENPEEFPDQADLKRLREAKSEIITLRQRCDEIIDGVLADKLRIDETVASVVDNYTPDRIDSVDRAILRLAVHEILHASAPAKVVINEAIELAKRYGTTDSHRFVNGVLDRVAKQHTGG